MSNQLDFTGVYAKVGRAEEHFKVVDLEIKTWLESGKHTYIPHRNSDFTRFLLTVRIYGPAPDLLRWTLIIGDCINNLRSSLDHLVYAIAKSQTANQPFAKIEKLAFVIADNEKDFSEWSRTRLKYIPRNILAAIKETQPYQRTNPDIPPFLGIVRDLANTDKHRLLRLAYAAVTGWDLEFSSPADPSITREWLVNAREIVDSSVAVELVSSKPEPQMKFHGGHMALSIALWHGFRAGESNPTSDRSDYSALLRLMIAEVKFVVDSVTAAAVLASPNCDS